MVDYICQSRYSPKVFSLSTCISYHLIALHESVQDIALDHRQSNLQHAFVRIKLSFGLILVDFEGQQFIQDIHRALDHQHLVLDVQLHVLEGGVGEPHLDQDGVAVVR